MSTKSPRPEAVLPAGVPRPIASPDGLDAPYWEATRRHEIVAQRCTSCRGWQWSPEWICHRCHGFELAFETVPGPARLYSWQRVWHPVHPALSDSCPYVVVLVEFPGADDIRMLGNLVGDAEAEIAIGSRLEPAFEDHDEAEPPYTLVQWRRVGDAGP